MDATELLTYVHVLLFVCWLGIDVGVFTSSFVIRRRGLSADARVEIRRLMRGLDLAPRLSLVLMVAVGPAMAHAYGMGATGWADAMLWALTAACLLWCTGIVWAWQRVDPVGEPRWPGDEGRARLFGRVDQVLRVVVAAFFVLTGVHSLVAEGLWTLPHIAWKALLFGVAVAVGLWIRVSARPFGPALRSVVRDGEDEALLQVMDRSMRRTYVAVLTIWSLVAVIAAIGVAGP